MFFLICLDKVANLTKCIGNKIVTKCKKKRLLFLCIFSRPCLLKVTSLVKKPTKVSFQQGWIVLLLFKA